jgi:hypothetical protein
MDRPITRKRRAPLRVSNDEAEMAWKAQRAEAERQDRERRMQEPALYVRRQWNDWKIARVALSDFEGSHWSNVSGGIQATAPRDFIHGYILCNRILSGEIAHSCRHGRGPHVIKVCIVQKDNDPEVFARIRASIKPAKAASIS